NLIGVRLPGNPSSIASMNPFWTTTSIYNSTGDATGETTNVLNTALDTIVQTRSKTYTYAHGHHRLTQQQIKVLDSPSSVFQVTDYFYDGDTTNTGTSGWKNLTQTSVYSSAAPTDQRVVQMIYSQTSDSPYCPGHVKQK